MRIMNIIRKVAVAGYEGLYEVDELGNIFSIKRPNAIGGLLKFTPDSFLKLILHYDFQRFISPSSPTSRSFGI